MRAESKGQVGRVQVGGPSRPAVGFPVARSGIACFGARAVVLYYSMCINLAILVLYPVDLGNLEHEGGTGLLDVIWPCLEYLGLLLELPSSGPGNGGRSGGIYVPRALGSMSNNYIKYRHWRQTVTPGHDIYPRGQVT